VPDLEAELEALYAGPLADFTARRNKLAGDLRKAGQGDAAVGVAALKKPSVPVWTINQLVRAEPKLLEAVVQAAEGLTQAQTGRTQASVGDAIEAHRDALRELVKHVDASAGRAVSDDVRQRIATTLRSASLDPSARTALALGRLDREYEEAGFDLIAEVGMGGRGARRSPAATTSRNDDLKRLEERRRAARGKVEGLRAELADAKKEARRAEREAAAASKKVDQVSGRLETEQQSLDGLDKELATLRSKGKTGSR
jgi:DNA repair exonuclease SbcCD ATPase subunit